MELKSNKIAISTIKWPEAIMCINCLQCTKQCTEWITVERLYIISLAWAFFFVINSDDKVLVKLFCQPRDTHSKRVKKCICDSWQTRSCIKCPLIIFCSGNITVKYSIYDGGGGGFDMCTCFGDGQQQKQQSIEWTLLLLSPFFNNGDKEWQICVVIQIDG